MDESASSKLTKATVCVTLTVTLKFNLIRLYILFCSYLCVSIQSKHMEFPLGSVSWICPYIMITKCITLYMNTLNSDKKEKIVWSVVVNYAKQYYSVFLFKILFLFHRKDNFNIFVQSCCTLVSCMPTYWHILH